MPPPSDHTILKPGPWVPIQFKHVPAEAMEHILLRLKERVYRMSDVVRMKAWVDDDSEDHLAPQQFWHVPFNSLYLVGFSSEVRSVLDSDMNPWGIRLTGDSPFQYNLRARYPNGLPVYHETFAKYMESIRRQGLNGGEEGQSTFGTIDQPSGFVFDSTKVEVKFVVPPEYYRYIVPDMRYEDDNALLAQHPMLKGADISIAVTIPPSWIKKIEKKGSVKIVSRLMLKRKEARRSWPPLVVE
jgi:hypothetical protein